MVKLLQWMILIVLVSAAVACDTTGKQSKNASASSAVELRLASYSVKSADDAGNPYKDEYTDVDYWMFDNFQQASGDSNSMLLNMQEGSKLLHCPIDSNGYKIPYRESLVRKEEAQKNGDKTLGVEGTTCFYATGVMSDEMYDFVEDMTYEVMAEYCPVIPEWLVNAQYERAALVPNGDILAVGPIDFFTGDLEDEQTASTKKKGCCGGSIDWFFYHYNSEGALLSADRTWVNTFEGLTVNDYPAPNMEVRKDGVIVFSEDDGSVVAAYDYDWTYLGTTAPSARDLHYFNFYPKSMLDRIYTAQQSITADNG